MKYKNILITGGAGFIGSNLAVSFKQKYPGLKVSVLDNLKRRGSELNLSRLNEHGVTFIHGDIRCPEDLVISPKVDLVIECSAEPSVLAGYGENPKYIINTNLLGTINCLEICRKHKADIVFLSTSRVYPYGAINNIKAKETTSRFEWIKLKGIDENFTTTGPKTLYGATKLASEIILNEYIANYGIKGIINRCGVIAGPWQFGKVDQGVFTLWMLAHYFKRPLQYIGFGAKGKQVRDLLHVGDLFELIDKQIVDLKKVSGRVYNVGGGREVSLSLLEATLLCEEITGNRIKISKCLNNRPGDIKVYLSDNFKVSKEFSWRPHSGPQKILSDIFAWVHKNEKFLKVFY